MREAINWNTLSMVLLALLLSSCMTNIKQPAAINGVLDLSAWDLKKEGVVKLDGQWEFYPDQLLSPDDFDDQFFADKLLYIELPLAWSDFEINGGKLQSYGYSTYRLQLKINDVDELKAIRVSKVLSAYNLWINGNRVASSGTVGKSSDTEIPELSLVIAEFETDQSDQEIILQVSNHHYRQGGVPNSIEFGTADKIRARQNKYWALTIVILSGLMIMAGFHFVLYLLRRKDLSPLWLGAYCVCWAVNNLFSSPSGWLIDFFLPEVPWSIFYRVGISAYFLSIPLLLMFLSALYPREASKQWRLFYQVLGLVFFAATLFFPLRLITEMVPTFHFFSFLLIAYLIYFLLKAINRNREGALIILSGLGILVLTGVNDILHDMGLIRTTYLIHPGLFIFILFQSLVISRRFSRAFTTVEKLSNELAHNNLELVRMDRLKDEFLVNTSHELRTPLNGMISVAESLLYDTGSRLNHAARNNLRLIAGSGQRLANLVDDILDFSRLNHKDLVLRRQPLDLYSLADMVMMTTRQLAKKKSLQLDNCIPKDLPAVNGDSDRVQQILYNLVGNAIKYTQRGRIVIGARQQAEQVIVCVSDTGAGIAEDQLDAIFHPFEHDSDVAKESSGLGLGLSRKLVELHGGSLSVESTLGKGSEFCFSLPCASVASSDRPVQRADRTCDWVKRQLQPVSMGRHTVDRRVLSSSLVSRILVVDDDPINLQLVVNYLTANGMAVVTAGSGEAALRQVELGERFDMVLLDLLMPGMNGYEVCRRLRQLYSVAELPVVMLTARKLQQDLVKGLDCGANDYLSKPFAEEELLARVRAQLKIKSAYAALSENQRLNREIEQRQQTEHNLRLTQQRLGALLDSVPEVILAVNENAEINFCNHAFDQLTGYRANQLLGKSLDKLFDGESAQQLRRWLTQMWEDDELQAHNLEIKYASHAQHQHVMLPKVLELEEERLLMLIVHPYSDISELKQASVALSLIESLNQNRIRLHTLEEALNGYTPHLVEKHPEFINILHDVDSVFAQLSESLSPEGIAVDRQLSIVNAMNLIIDCWCEGTHTSKSELARKSGLWKVYTNEDGWDRTQTMDRYFSLQTLPRYPRLKQVIRTAEFVLTYCHLDTGLRHDLEHALVQLRQLN